MLNSPTKLSPLEEVLFKSWARAHGVDNHDDPNNQFDHRGLYKQTNGQMMQPHVLRQMAAMHNKAMEPQEESGGDMVNPDPYMAQAEMHGNQLKADGDKAKLRAQFDLENQKHKHKLEVEQMKLQHKSQQSERDRQLNAQQADRDRQMQAHQSQVDRQNAVQDAQMNRQNGVQDQVMKEHFARTRPQPAPQGAGAPQQGPHSPQMPLGSPQSPPQATQPGGQGLQHQLMSRAIGGR